MAEKKPIICLDAGHGGYDPGAVKGKREEEDDALKLVLAIGKKLARDYTVSVVYTRKTDIYESPSKKAQDSDDANADLFVSIHRNSASPTGEGYETLVFENSGVKKELANKLNKRMAGIGFKNRGTKVRKDLTVLKKTDAPSVLLEVGFISSAKDNKLFDEKFNKIVDAIVLSIAEVMDLKRKPVVTKTPKKLAVGNYNSYVETTTNLNVRDGRGTHNDLLGTLKKGTKVKVLYIADYKGTLWGSINYGKNVGYISLNYVKAVL